jgi:tripartite-type tricarboxylate transporter receptor subunit TctC
MLARVHFGRSLCLLLSGAVIGAAPAGAHAQDRALQAVRIVVPMPAGGTADLVARLVADGLRKGLGQPVVVENKPGATGRIAIGALRSAAADGTTLLLAPIWVPVIGPLVLRDPNYDPAKDLAPVAQIAKYEFAFAVAASHPARTVSEFAAWAQANPARASVGNPGAGSLPHFLGVMLGREAGLALVQVPYKGVGPLEVELIGGQIAAGISAVSDFIPLHRAGKLRILATSGAKRSPLLPAVPTFREQGFQSLEAAGWHGLYAPAGTPQAVIDRLSRMVDAALQDAELRDRFIALGLAPTGTTPEALAAIMAADTARWAPIIKASGVRAD